MNIRSYLDILPHGGVKQFASQCDIAESYLLQLAARQDNRLPSAKLCNVFVRESGGLLTYEDLRPDDWREIWPAGTPVPTAGRRSTDVAGAKGA